MSQILKIVGPPGTGKTRTLLELLETELRSVFSNRIAFLTFTRAARLEALKRTGKSSEEFPFLRTIHALCYQQLGIQQGQILGLKDLNRFGNEHGIRFTGAARDPWLEEELDYTKAGPTRADFLLQLQHLGRHRGIALKEAMRTAPPDLDYHYAKWFTETYKRWKVKENLYDYTDLLTRYLEHGKALDVDVVFVDESQDLSRLQWRVVHKFAGDAARLYLAGDDDQAIFTWAGADAAAFIEHPCTETRSLRQSFRLPRNVHLLAGSVAGRISKRLDKNFDPRGGSEGRVGPAGHLSEEILRGPSSLVLFRNQYRGVELARQLMRLDIPFGGYGSPLTEGGVNSALKGWLHVMTNEEVPGKYAWAMVQASSAMWYQLGAAQAARRKSCRPEELFRVTKAQDWHEVLHRLPHLPYLRRVLDRWGFDACLHPTVQLMSIHQSKGREAETVVLDLEMARATYDHYLREPDDEHRVWYVGITRAKEQLYTLMPMNPMAYPI